MLQIRHKRCGDVVLLRVEQDGLAGLDLTEAYLRGVEMTGLDCRSANLTRAVLKEAVLARSDLRGALLQQADLTRADLHDADLRGTDLRGAHVAGADFTGARSDASTLWPDDFYPALRGVIDEPHLVEVLPVVGRKGGSAGDVPAVLCAAGRHAAKPGQPCRSCIQENWQRAWNVRREAEAALDRASAARTRSEAVLGSEQAEAAPAASSEPRARTCALAGAGRHPS